MAVLVSGCQNDCDSAALSIRSLLEARCSAGFTTFDLGAASPFKWDRMFVFGPYTNQQAVDKALGFHWDGFVTSLESADSFDLVVFVTSGKVTHWFEEARGPVELDRIGGGIPYDSSHAVFKIVRDSDGTAFLER
jgi:hypothetical protein